MKRIIIQLTFLIFCAQLLSGQEYSDETFSFDDTLAPTQDVSYHARDLITLAAGFYGDGTDGNILMDIDDAIICSILSSEYVNQDTIENRTIDTSLDFGSLPGSFNVGSTGAANYTIPVYSPPGYKKMTPSLSINYSSSRQDGLLGVGWTLSGSSTIHRMPKTIHHDSVVGGIDMDEGDILALNGNRLVLSSGSYGESGSKYHTRMISFQTIEAFGTTGDGPGYFKVTANNGYEFEYGNTADSKVELDGETTIFAWKLNKVTDPNGNYILYEYDNSNSGQAYLTSILYTGNTNAECLHERNRNSVLVAV